ncbi:MAG: nucleotidyltransferase family protein [Oscillospiraceae bacterium]|nr:nucleotidyltransferase family protein [Oscillospiraceae bacterium]
MRTAGIVAEYNPFHSGHQYHIAQTRARLGADTAVVCVMSGSFVQRGEAAIADKWARAEMALRSGADLVLELPLTAALSSAEGFARGAVQTLAAAGVTDVLSFGCESGALEPLQAVADCLNSPAFSDVLRGELRGGIPFAAARERAVEALLGREAAAPLRRPNDILAIEYLRALPGTGMTPLAVRRQGAAHDGTAEESEYPSAAALRARLMKEETPPAGWMPPASLAVWERECLAGRAPVDIERGQRGILALLRTRTREDFAALPDSGGGLADRLYRASREAGSWQELLELAGTKHYTNARIRRLFLRAALDLREQTLPPWLRLLGSNARGRMLLARMRDDLPILTKPSHVRRMGPEAEAAFSADLRAADLYGLCMPVVTPGSREWRTSPVTLE